MYISSKTNEKDFLEKNIQSLHIKGFIAEEYFIDIGVPEDYDKVEREIKLIIDKSNKKYYLNKKQIPKFPLLWRGLG